jgi:threonine synthase
MRYISTRGEAPKLSFNQVVLAGLAEDGGLYLPEKYSSLGKSFFQNLVGKPYKAVALEMIKVFSGNDLIHRDLVQLLDDIYSQEKFHHPALAPLTQYSHNHYILELYHGPTIAFKDYALQLLGGLFDLILAKSGQKRTIIGATSGDTGSAAIAACANKKHLQCFILYPHERTSPIQRQQMTTWGELADNIHTIAYRGTFDDCQSIVKSLFNDDEFRHQANLSAVNSINWARILGQVIYYVYAAINHGGLDQPFSVCVPTGNFGNIFAAFVAKKIGLPLNKLIIASNRNDILARFFTSRGRLWRKNVEQSYSPSMDIQISSNFERLLFEASGRNSVLIKQFMADFHHKGDVNVNNGLFHNILGYGFNAHSINDDRTLETIKTVYHNSGILLDPHSAVGVSAALQYQDERVMSLACASPAKFPHVVAKATGITPSLPTHVAEQIKRKEDYQIFSKAQQVRDYIAQINGFA